MGKKDKSKKSAFNKYSITFKKPAFIAVDELKNISSEYAAYEAAQKKIIAQGKREIRAALVKAGLIEDFASVSKLVSKTDTSFIALASKKAAKLVKKLENIQYVNIIKK